MFEEALGQAQALGYAERNPEADVEGYDACRKIAILTSLVAGKTVDFHKIHTEGITGIDPTDFAYAKKLDATIKLLAVSRETEDGYQISVAPYLLKKKMPLPVSTMCSTPWRYAAIRWAIRCFTDAVPESCRLRAR